MPKKGCYLGNWRDFYYLKCSFVSSWKWTLDVLVTEVAGSIIGINTEKVRLLAKQNLLHKDCQMFVIIKKTIIIQNSNTICS